MFDCKQCTELREYVNDLRVRVKRLENPRFNVGDNVTFLVDDYRDTGAKKIKGKIISVDETTGNCYYNIDTTATRYSSISHEQILKEKK